MNLGNHSFKLFESKENVVDKYTFVLSKIEVNIYECIGLSVNPTDPSFGFFQHCECKVGKHLGKEIGFESLEEGARKALNRYFNNY